MKDTRQTMRKQRFTYKKSLGQHFIYDEALIEQLVDAAGVTEADRVLEIGPGSGSLTAALARRAQAVTAIELDAQVLPLLRVSLERYSNVRIVEADAMTADLRAIIEAQGAPCRLVANLPYYITTPLLMRLFTEQLPLTGIAVMVQEEVGDKLMARPGTAAYGPLAVWAQAMTMPRMALHVPAAAFTPPPKVDSSFMVLPLREPPLVAPEAYAPFDRMVKAAFAMRRKTLANNLQMSYAVSKQEAEAILTSHGLMANVRGEALAPEMLHALALSPALVKKTTK